MNTPVIIDTHAHVYHHRLQADVEQIVHRAKQVGVSKVVMPAIDVPSIHQALSLCDAHEGYYAMVGLHPSEAKTATNQDWDDVVALAGDPRVVAVGETGLDYYWDRTFDKRQEDFLRRQLLLASDMDLPVVFHLRDRPGRDEAHQRLVQILREESYDGMRGVFHCFTGPEWVAAAAMELGFHLGIGGVVTFKNAGLDALVRKLPLRRIVLETDAPFLAPVPYRGKRNEPAYVRIVAEKVAEAKEIPLEEVSAVTAANAEMLFGI